MPPTRSSVLTSVLLASVWLGCGSLVPESVAPSFAVPDYTAPADGSVIRAGSAVPTASAGRGSLTGRVLDRETGRPLTATLWTEGSETSSAADAEGWFRMDGLAPGDVRVYAAREGYASTRSVLKVRPDTLQRLTVLLARER